MKSGALRHIVNVMRPTENQASRGEREGKDTLLIANVPCSIDTLTGRDADRVHSSWPEATYKIEMYADPSRLVTPRDYLTGGTLGERRLWVEHVEDVQERRFQLILFCSEAK